MCLARCLTRYPLFAGFPRCLVLTIALIVVPGVSGQADQPFSGIVTDKGGQPIVGVTVFGAIGKTCCPFKRDQATTDGKGAFRLGQPGAVVHFYQEGYGPLTYVVKPGTSEVHVTLNSVQPKLLVPVCGAPVHGQKQIGWGEYGVRFSAPADEVTIKGGKPDVDYVKYLVKPKTGDSWLEFWFGPYALSTEPDDEYFVNSVDFSQKAIQSVQERIYGVDSSGHRADGTTWRWTAILAHGGGRYETKNETDAHLFDRIIDSICFAPYPRK